MHFAESRLAVSPDGFRHFLLRLLSVCLILLQLPAPFVHAHATGMPHQGGMHLSGDWHGHAAAAGRGETFAGVLGKACHLPAASTVELGPALEGVLGSTHALPMPFGLSIPVSVPARFHHAATWMPRPFDSARHPPALAPPSMG